MSLNFLSQLGLQFQVGPMTTTLMGLKERKGETVEKRRTL